MITVDCQQGSPAWDKARRGIPTASNFSKIVTTTGKKSTQANTYMNGLLAEWLSGETEDSYSNGYMERGKEVEEEARDYLQLQTDLVVNEVGFVYKDDHKLVGCSPDGLIETGGGVELKCPIGSTQIDYLFKNKLPTEYLLQVHGAMWITGVEYWKFLSYHPSLPQLMIHVERDEKIIRMIEMHVQDFIALMLEKRNKLFEMGYKPNNIKEVAA